jgi:hypothetical protein
MMGTVIDAVEMGTLRFQEILHLVMDSMDQRFREITPCHSGLIGDNNCFEAILVDQSDRLRHAGKENKSFEMVQIPHLLIDRSVPIEKNRPVCHAVVQCGMRLPAAGRDCGVWNYRSEIR